MRAISVKQPWAHAIVTGRKDVENRVRPHPWRGAVGEVIALHSSLGTDTEVTRSHPAVMNYVRAVRDGQGGTECGAVLGTVRLVDVHEAWEGCCDSKYAERDCWHLVLDDLRPLTVPIACRGALGLWTLPELVERGIAFQLTTMQEAFDPLGEAGMGVLAMATATGSDLVEIPGLFDYTDEKGD